MSNGETTGGFRDEGRTGWEILGPDYETQIEEVEDEENGSEKRDIREFLNEEQLAKLEKARALLREWCDKKDFLKGRRYFVEGADEQAAAVMFPEVAADDASEAVPAAMRLADSLTEDINPVVAALDYVTIRDRAKTRLAEFSEAHAEEFDDIDRAGIQEYERTLNPEQGDDITRLQYGASILADGTPKSDGSAMIFWKNDPNKDLSGIYAENEPLLRARIRDFGNYAMLRQSLAEQLGRSDLLEYNVANILNADTQNDAVLNYLRYINPARLDRSHGERGDPDRDSLPEDFDVLEGADISNLVTILGRYDGSPLNSTILARNLTLSEILELPKGEAESLGDFIGYIGEQRSSEDFPEGRIGEELTTMANALLYSGVKTREGVKKGALVREKGGEQARKFFEQALAVARNESDPLRLKKIQAMYFMLCSGSARADQVEGFENLFRAMDAGDEVALGTVEDENFPDGAPNPDANKNWSRGFGLGIADYSVACYVSPATPMNIQRLVLEHDSLPSLSKTTYFQNREDSRVLSGDEKNYDEPRIFESRDFIHNEMPHAHEVLVYTWAYQKIGRGEAISDEEYDVLRSIGVNPPRGEMNDEERAGILSSIRESYLDFLEQNDELSEVVLGNAILGVPVEERNLDDLSAEEVAQRLRRGRSALLDKMPFDLSRYDAKLSVLDTETGATKSENMSEILWRLVKNTDHRKIEAPRTGDAELDEILSKIDLTIGSNGSAPVELRDLREALSAINQRLLAIQGKYELSPQLIDAISFVSRASNYAAKDLPPKELRELFYDPTFKEMIRFHALTASGDAYRSTDFDALWNRFASGAHMEDSDEELLARYRELNKTILNQVEPMVSEYRTLADQQVGISEDLRRQIHAPRFPSEYFGTYHYRTIIAYDQEASVHDRQASVERNFANSVWSLNLSSTLAKIGQGLA